MNKKLQLILSKMIIESTQLRYGYSSSSKEFQNKLEQAGIVLPEKLYIPYKFPNSQTPQQYEKLANTFEFYELFPDYLSVPDNLAESEKQELTAHIMSEKQKYTDMLPNAMSELIKLNPELGNINIKQNKIVDFLKGAAYGFAPEEIDYFSNEYRGRTPEIEKFENDIFGLLGFKPGYILSPKHRQVVLSAAQANYMARNQSRSIV